MLDYSKTAFNKIYNDFKKVKRVFDIVVPLFSIAYLTYAVIAKTGILAANIVLLILSVGYYGFHLFMMFRGGAKSVKKIVKTIYKICVRVIKLFTLAVAVYGLWLTIENVNPLSLILTIASLLGWVLQVLLDIVMHIINRYAAFVREAIMADVESLMKPINSTRDFFKRVTGKPVEEKEVSKTRERLDEMVNERKEEIKAEKAEAKAQKKQDKLDEKERKRLEKAQDKFEKQQQKLAQAQGLDGVETQEEVAASEAPDDKKRALKSERKDESANDLKNEVKADVKNDAEEVAVSEAVETEENEPKKGFFSRFFKK